MEEDVGEWEREGEAGIRNVQGEGERIEVVWRGIKGYRLFTFSHNSESGLSNKFLGLLSVHPIGDNIEWRC